MKNDGEEDGGGFVLSPKKGNSRSGSLLGKSMKEMSKVEAMEAYKSDLEKEKRIIEDERIAAQEDLNKLGDKANLVIIMPSYSVHPKYKVDIEDAPPPK